jgi:hypothetical protein
MTSEGSTVAYLEAETMIHGLYQRFQYGFGGYVEVLLTLLQKQHWQAAADIMALVDREKTNFEGMLLGMQATLAEKRFKEESREDENSGNGHFPGEAAASGEAAP